MLRWVWWRANAWTEIVGMISAILTAVLLYKTMPGTKDEYILVAVIVVSTICSLAATFLTKPVPKEKLKAFREKVRPVGAWGPVAVDAAAEHKGFWRLAGAWALGAAGVYGLMFGIGHMILTSVPVGIAFLIFAFFALKSTLKLIEKEI